MNEEQSREGSAGRERILGIFGILGIKSSVLPAGDAAPSWREDLCSWEGTEGDDVLNKRFGCVIFAYQRKLARKNPGCLMNCSDAH